MERHDLIYIRESGYEYAIACAHCPLCDDAAVIAETIQGARDRKPVPGIVRTQWRAQDGILDVGYVSSSYIDGNRIRIASSIHIEDIEDVMTPKEIFAMESLWPESKRVMLAELRSLAERCHCNLGLFGSVALEMVTGETYLREHSDIDMVLYPESDADLETFYRQSLILQQIHDTRCDIEIGVRTFGNAKLSELLSDSTTVLCKSLYGPSVYKKETLKKII